MKSEKQIESSAASAGKQMAHGAPAAANLHLQLALAEGFISKRELASRLRKTVRTVSNWQRRGVIPCMKCGRSVLFKWTEVEAHLREMFPNCPPHKQARDNCRKSL